MEQAELQKMFRQQELQRRAARRALRLNEAALEHEVLDAEAQVADAAAKASLIRQQLTYEKETSPGYWTRLWHAVLGK